MRYAQCARRSFFSYLIILFFVLLIAYCKVLNFNESTGLQIHDLHSYQDGTILIHMINPNRKNCSTPALYFRLLHTNKTLTSISVSATEMPAFNFCELRIKGTVYYYIKIYPLLENYIFATYVNSSNPADASVYGLLVDWNGKFVSNTYLNIASVNKEGVVQPPGKIYFSMKSTNTGFLYVDVSKKTGNIIWNYFTKPSMSNLNISNINSGIIMSNGSGNALTSGFLNAEGNYCLVVTRFYSGNKEPINDHLPLRVETILIPTRYNQTTSTHLLYSTNFSNIIAMNCNIDYNGSGNICQLYSSGGNNVTNAFILRLSFLTSGNLLNTETKSAKYVNKSNEVKINPLPFGGYLLTASTRNQQRRLIYGYILNSTGDFQGHWPLPQPFFVNSKGQSYKILPDNKIIAAVQTNATNLFLNTTQLPKIPISNDKGYYNPQINLTLPVINGTIPIRASQIFIQYKNPVQLSVGNVSIFLHSESLSTEPEYLRQVYSGQSGYCTLSDDSKTVTINIFRSTFNQPSTDYFVVINDNFVKINKTGEAVKGIQANMWRFKTEQIVPGDFVESSVGLLRLTVAGSMLYESLNKTEKMEFVNNLSYELATVLPVTSSRLVPKYLHQRDPTTEEVQNILTLEIISSTNTSKVNVANIIGDLNSLIIHRDMNPLALMTYTNLLDSNYGFIKSENFWNKYLLFVILFILGILLVGLLCLIEQRRKPKAETAAAFKFFIGFVSYLLFVIFTFKYSKAVQGLYTTSLTIVILSASVKESIAIFLITKEIKYHNKFKTWVKKHYLITAIFTFLSAVEIYSLMILSSKIGGHPSLNAVFSKNMHRWIFWVGLFALIKKEIPQFIIVLIYYHSSLNLDLVPFLSLLITSVILVFNAVWRLNQLFSFLSRSKKPPISRRASHYKNGNTGYETDREDNDHDMGTRDTLQVPDSEVIFESDEFGSNDDELGTAGKEEEEKKKEELGTESDDEKAKSFIEEEMKHTGEFK